MNGLLWWILIIIPWIGVIVLTADVILRETGRQKMVAEGKTAMDILKELYAKGEITREQFREMSEELRK
jgi:putative membrane protein